MKFLPSIVVLAATLLAVSCKKDDPKIELPAATQEGKNVGGCLIDGEVWQTSASHGSVVSGPGTAAVVSKKVGQSTYQVSIFLSSGSSGRLIELNCKNAFAPAGYGRCAFNTDAVPAPAPEPSFARYQNGAAPGNAGDFVTGSTATGWLEVTYFNPQKSIIAGRFAFTGRDAASGRTVIISEGRFDTNCYYLELP